MDHTTHTIYATKQHRIVHTYTNWDTPQVFRRPTIALGEKFDYQNGFAYNIITNFFLVVKYDPGMFFERLNPLSGQNGYHTRHTDIHELTFTKLASILY